MLISLFSPGARQSFFSTITQSAGHHSVYLHCVWKVHTLKSFEVTGDIDGSRSQDSWLPKNHQVYPGLPWRIHWKGVISVVREAVLSVPRRPRRPPRPGDPRLSPLARTEWRWQGATAVVAVLKSFQQQSQIGAVVWSSIRHLMIFFYRCSIMSSSTGSMDIGAPDRSSRFQWMLDVVFPSSKFPWSSRVVISGASLSWSTQHVLLKHPVLEFIHIFDICRGDSSWTPMSQCEEWETCFYALNHYFSNTAMRILINSMYWRVSVRVSAVLRQRARVDLVREERQTELVNLLMDKASWLHGWASSTAVAQRCQLQWI